MSTTVEAQISNDEIKSNQQSVLSKNLSSIPIGEICRALEADGFFKLENAAPLELVDKILKEANASDIGLNKNDVAPVRLHSQTFFSNIMASSPTFVRLVSDPVVHAICRSYLGSQFRLKCQRYYESGYGYQIGWHTDNKTVNNVKTTVKGLVFIIYLSDTYDGELQAIKGSHNWSGEALTNNFKHEDLQRDHAEKILSLKGPKGTLVITDTYTIHRTRMITTKGFVRKSLFFQIDNDLLHSEKMIINPEYFGHLNKDLMAFFGFGLPSGYQCMPVSGVHTLNKDDLKKLMVTTLKEYAKRSWPLRSLAKLKSGRADPDQAVINPY